MVLPDYFAFYGLPQSFYPDVAVVRRQYYTQSKNFHPDRIQSDVDGALDKALEMSALNNEAYKTLTDPDETLRYILKLHAIVADDEAFKLPPDFLMEMMELNEAIAGAESDPDKQADAVREISSALKSWEVGIAPYVVRFDAGERSPELFAALKDCYYRKKYLLRLKDHISL